MSALRLTPMQRAEHALANSTAFCNLLADARRHKAPGYWEGSAFRHHPCGLVADTVKLTNHWHVDDLCDVAITDGAGWDTRNISRDSFGYGSPHPAPVEGGSLTVWRCGQWIDPLYKQQLEARLLEILSAAAEHVGRAEEIDRIAAAKQQAEETARHRLLAATAIAKAAGRSA